MIKSCLESTPMPINNPDHLNQPQTPEGAGADPQSPAPTHVSNISNSSGCVSSIISKISEDHHPISATTDTHHNPPSKPARTAAGFYFRWTIIVLNVGLELAQIILTLEASDGRIKGPTYRTLTATTSSICLLLSAVEATRAIKPNGVVLLTKKRRALRIGFPLWFGLVSSTVQLCVNVTALAVKRAIVNVDYLGLLFAVCYFFAAINGERSGHVAVVKCVSHGSCEAEGKFVDGMWVFECSLCTAEKHAA